MSAETALAHAGLSGENWKREVVGQMVADPVVKRSKLVLGNLKGQKLTELRLPARSLEKDDQITSDGQRRRAAQILLQQAPQVPTFVELGLRDSDVDLWFGVLAPAGTPKDIVDHYNAVLNEILAQPRVRAVLDKQGLIAQGGSPERLSELIEKDRLRWAKVVKDAGITSD